MELQYALFGIAFWVLGGVAGGAALFGGTAAAADGSAYDFTFDAIEGGPLPLSRYEGKALLVVNTASFCGFTHQYAGLQDLWERYRDRGLVVIGVPSNDFGAQEPGTSGEIKDFCETNYHIDFPLTDKVRVKGTDAHPFYRWLAARLGPAKAPRWNFHKYLIDRDGQPVAAFATHVRPEAPGLTRAVEDVLAKHR